MTVFSEQVTLEGGGEVTVVRFGDGIIRLSFERDGVRFGFPLTIADLRALKLATSAVVIADHLAGLETES